MARKPSTRRTAVDDETRVDEPQDNPEVDEVDEVDEAQPEPEAEVEAEAERPAGVRVMSATGLRYVNPLDPTQVFYAQRATTLIDIPKGGWVDSQIAAGLLKRVD